MDEVTKSLQDIKLQLANLSAHISNEVLNNQKNFVEIYKTLDRHKEILFGNEKEGLISKVNNSTKWIEEKQNNSTHVFNALYKALIFAFVSYIAWKLGLKQ